MKAVMLATAATGVAALNPIRGLDEKHAYNAFGEFKLKFNKIYDSLEEEQQRFVNFKANMAEAAKNNLKSKGKATFGVTMFSDMSKTEFKQKMTGFKPAKNRVMPKKKVQVNADGSITSIDWRNKGPVSPVKNQGQCGSCWAFSATEAVETGYYFNSGELRILSPQQTVSCDTRDMACNGGDTLSAYAYMEKAGGVEDNSDYPYTSGDTGSRGKCDVNKTKFDVKIDSTETISSSSSGESDMYSEIQKTPMSVCVDAESWQTYTGGVVDRSTCGTQLDHCVQAVGISDEGYWIVKNQWTTGWGEDGYIRVKTGENACGIAEEATIVKASKASSLTVEAPTQEVIDIVTGVADGFGMTMTEDCVEESETMVKDIAGAIELMEKKDPEDVMKGLTMIAEALKENLPQAAKNCGASEDEIKQLVQALEVMGHPKEFIYKVGKNLIINGVDVFKHINGAIGSWKGQDYKGFGEHVGHAAKDLLIGKSGSEDIFA
jgi:C1A family cysteine protease